MFLLSIIDYCLWDGRAMKKVLENCITCRFLKDFYTGCVKSTLNRETLKKLFNKGMSLQRVCHWCVVRVFLFWKRLYIKTHSLNLNHVSSSCLPGQSVNSVGKWLSVIENTEQKLKNGHAHASSDECNILLRKHLSRKLNTMCVGINTIRTE